MSRVGGSHPRAGTSEGVVSPADRIVAALLGVERSMRWEDAGADVLRERIRWSHRRRAQRRLRRLRRC